MHSSFLLGFDAREMWLSGRDAWDEERKQLFLLRLDVEKPLSIDRAVWASVFDKYPAQRPAYIGIWEEGWEELRRLEECLDKHKTLLGRFYIVAFTVMKTVCTSDELAALAEYLKFLKAGDPCGAARMSGRETGMADPSIVDPQWSSLGYDVADLGLTSALTNMGRLPDEDVDSLRAQWGAQLNSFHLFNHCSQANEFKNYSSRRVPEHAPFFVYGLWLIKDVSDAY